MKVDDNDTDDDDDEDEDDSRKVIVLRNEFKFHTYLFLLWKYVYETVDEKFLHFFDDGTNERGKKRARKPSRRNTRDKINCSKKFPSGKFQQQSC